MTEIYRDKYTKPALNGEPYYAGYGDPRALVGGYAHGAKGGTPKDEQFVHSGMYGNVLSGGLAGHVYGAEGIWGADIEAAAPTKMWDAFQWGSGGQMQYLRKFMFSIGTRYQELAPDSGLVVPSETQFVKAYEGWAYAARTPDKKIFMLYFETGCPTSRVRGSSVSRASIEPSGSIRARAPGAMWAMAWPRRITSARFNCPTSLQRLTGR